MRIDIISRKNELRTSLNDFPKLKELGIEYYGKASSYFIENNDESETSQILETLYSKVDQKLLTPNLIESSKINTTLQVSFKPGVTDNSARSTSYILQKKCNPKIKVATGNLFFFYIPEENKDLLLRLKDLFYNDLIQKGEVFVNETQIPEPKFPQVKLELQDPECISLDLSNRELEKLSKERLLALSLEEMLFIKEYYNNEQVIFDRKNKGLPKWPVDIELEILAQTWSEHCKHKIFSAHINYTEESGNFKKIGSHKLESVFKTHIKNSTEIIKKEFNKDWLISVFTDNAGIVRFDDNIDYCLKVETHNSPSALDPYGGALTGILGVNRDILGCGIGAKPVANTNVLCFGPPNYSKEILSKLPKKLKDPSQIMKGVHRGIEDGGNKSGIPTVNGAITFNDNYAGKPLVYCGTVGVMPQTLNGIPTYKKNHEAGDLIVICGGSVGADGIHGATFSSMELDDNAPSTAVQIGDPFTQKKLTDFLLEARDLGLYNSITDNGAGGLSSSVGEMAEKTNGASIDINKVPLKYKGLSPYEIVISESQERMTFSVPKNRLEDFLQLAEKREVNPAVIGEFHDKGSFDIYSGEKLLASLSLKLMHEDLPPMQLNAHFEGPKEFLPWHREKTQNNFENYSEKIHHLMSLDNIRSKRDLVSQYDQEVKAATIIKPFIQKNNFGPSDAAVIWSGAHGGNPDSAICISSGLTPQISHIDTYKMTEFSIDEAFRNAIASGANPHFIALCDNYCWPDPIKSEKNPDGNHKLAQLVRSGQALYDMALSYKAPFISGKDSMKNDFIGENPDGENCKISVPPTLLITSIGKVDHLQDIRTTDFKNQGDLVYFLGDQSFNQEYYHSLNTDSLELPLFDREKTFARYENIHKFIQKGYFNSLHDVSDGGLIAALIESCFPNNFGINLDKRVIKDNENFDAFLFNEVPGSFIISIRPEHKEEFESVFKNESRFLGEVESIPSIKLPNKEVLEIETLYKKWSHYEA